MSELKALYKISDDFAGLQKMVSDGEVTPEMIEDTLEGVTAMFEQKANAVVIIANEYKRRAEMIDSEITRLQDMKRSMISQQNSLKEYLRLNMERTGISKIECDLFKITLRKPTVTCQINNESDLPDDYVNVKTVITPDKRKILADLKSGIEVEGAELSTGKSSILIK